MAAHALTEAAAPLLDPAGYSARNLALSATAHAALNAWITLSLARLGLRHGLIADTRIALTIVSTQALLAPPPVARRLARDLVSLRCALAVADALTPAPDRSDRRVVLLPLA